MLPTFDDKEHPMARTLVVVPRRPRKAAKSTSNADWRLAAALWRYLSQLAALPDRGATLGLHGFLAGGIGGICPYLGGR